MRVKVSLKTDIETAKWVVNVWAEALGISEIRSRDGLTLPVRKKRLVVG